MVGGGFLHKHDLHIISRFHRVAEDEYEIFAKRQWVPLFPTTNYCGEFGRGGAVLCAAETLIRSFQILKTAEEKGAQCLKASRRCDDPGGREEGSI